MVCEIANVVFDFNLLSDGPFYKSLLSYKSDKDFEVKITSKKINEIILPSIEPKVVSQFYQLYIIDNKYVQYQKDEDGVYYGIIYYGNDATIMLSRDDINHYEYILSMYIANYFIFKKQTAILMHASSILYNGHAYLISAKSGTGKSTHASLWRKYGNAISINDDKNYLIYENGKLMVYGSPWSGKHYINNNIKNTVDGILFIYQNKENEIKKMDQFSCLISLLEQIETPNWCTDKEKWDLITNELLKIKAYKLGCNISKEAFELAKNTLEE